MYSSPPGQLLLLYFLLASFASTTISQSRNGQLFYLSSSKFFSLDPKSPTSVVFPSPLVALTPDSSPDSETSSFFVSDISSQHGSRIYRLELPSDYSTTAAAKMTPIQTLLGEDVKLGMIRSMGFDAERSLLFVADTEARALLKIELVSDTEVKTMETIVSFNETDKPLSIAFHRCSNTLYWTNWNRDHPCIERSNVDGSGRSMVVQKGLSQPSAVSFDPWNKSHLFWIDEDRSQGTFKVERSLLDGTEREVICSASGSSNIFDLTVDEHFIYWSDWKNMVIWKTAKTRQQSVDCQMEPVKRLNSRPMGISVPHPHLNTNAADCLDLDFKPMTHPAANLQKIPDEDEVVRTTVDDDDGGPCASYCLNGADCTVTSSNIPVCLCDHGFSGDRCEVDQCQNYCLNDGHCSRAATVAFPSTTGLPNATLPNCRCGPGFLGHRCQITTLERVQEPQFLLPFILLIALLSGSLVISCCLILFLSLRSKKRLEEALSGKKPQIVRKRSTSRSFSGNRESSSSAAGKLNSAAFREACGTNETNSGCGGGGSGVVIDLEDCCKMTLCDTPCVEATFRKPTNRKKRTLSSSNCRDSHQDRQLLIDSEIPPAGRLDEICT